MNWYKIKTSSPLPEVSNKFPFEKDHSILVKRVDNNLSNDTKNKLDSENIERSYLGIGSQGIAYDIGNDAVEKITLDPYEFDTAKHIMKLQKEIGFLPFSVGVFYAEKIQESPDLYRIVMEKTIPLNEEEQEIFRKNFTNYYIQEHLRNFTGNDFLDGILQFARHLREYKFWPRDLGPKNVGRRKDGSFIILDLGSIEKI